MKRVYFIKPIGMDGPIKIGCSRVPAKRKSALETWSPFPLEIVAEIEGDFTLERRFHALFRDCHERQEWFSCSPELLQCITEINAGTFDTATLPEPVHLSGILKGEKRPAHVGPQLSLSLRVMHTERRTGYAAPCRCYDVIKTNDLDRLSKLEAYLSNPAAHGVPILADWAARTRGFMEARRPQQAAA